LNGKREVFYIQIGKMENLLCHNEEFGIGAEGHGKQLEVLKKGK